MKVLTCGVFDLFHDSHRHYLQSIRDTFPKAHLIVAMGDNASVRRLKGKDRPRHDAEVRQRNVEETGLVDEVVVFDIFGGHTEYEAGHNRLLQETQPDIVISGEASPNRGIEPFLDGIPHLIIDFGDAQTRITTTGILSGKTGIWKDKDTCDVWDEIAGQGEETIEQ